MSRILAMDCEMVGSYHISILARVSIVDQYGKVVLDEYVKPIRTVTDYRTAVSGIKKKDIENGKDFLFIRKKVANLLKGCILVGQSLQYDLDALMLTHPNSKRRDLANYMPFLRTNRGKSVALRTLARRYLGRIIQNGEHDSIEDAKACMDLYLKFPNNW